MATPEYKFSLIKAIQSLDNLNEQIVQYIFSSDKGETNSSVGNGLLPKEHDALRSSIVLIRKLLNDAQGKFRKMVEDNKELAAHIDGSINSANQEVNALRSELLDTNKRLSEIASGGEKKDVASQCDFEYTPRQKTDEENELKRLREENARLETRLKVLEQDDLKDLTAESVKFGEVKLELIQAKQELGRAKDALQGMKADRKRLKAEKLELLTQMKQLYTTLEDKETELRDFIRNYETRMRENDETIKQLASERKECEQEKWDLIKQLRDTQECTFILRKQLETKDGQIKKLEADLAEAKDQQVSQGYSLNLSNSPNSIGFVTSNSDELPPYETPPSSAPCNSKDSSLNLSLSESTLLTPPTEPPPPIPVEHDSPTLSVPGDRQRSSSLIPLLDTTTTTADGAPNRLDLSHSPILLEPNNNKTKKKKLSLNSISRVFSRGRIRRSIAVPAETELEDCPPNSRLTLLNTENYQDKLSIVEQSRGSHMSTWKANQVLAWLEIVINMPAYGKACAENIKSGKVLLGLSDSELGSALGITKPMHKKKIRLAIEEQRSPADITYPKASLMDHTWIAHRWVPDLGLPQYTSVFEDNLMDGRLLNILSRKEMEKYFSIHRRFHQSSILHGVELLRRLSFDKETLNERRSSAQNSDSDPLVWTNERVIKWIQTIDLEEYANNLKESGVHGALMVLEPQFTADTLANALAIPPSKSYIRRHLKTELDALVKPARNSINVTNGHSIHTFSRGSTLSRSFRSSSMMENTGSKSRLSFRGSLGRAFGKKVREDMSRNISFDVETPRRKISAPMNFQHNSLQALFEKEPNKEQDKP